MRGGRGKERNLGEIPPDLSLPQNDQKGFSFSYRFVELFIYSGIVLLLSVRSMQIPLYGLWLNLFIFFSVLFVIYLCNYLLLHKLKKVNKAQC